MTEASVDPTRWSMEGSSKSTGCCVATHIQTYARQNADRRLTSLIIVKQNLLIRLWKYKIQWSTIEYWRCHRRHYDSVIYNHRPSRVTLEQTSDTGIFRPCNKIWMSSKSEIDWYQNNKIILKIYVKFRCLLDIWIALRSTKTRSRAKSKCVSFLGKISYDMYLRIKLLGIRRVDRDTIGKFSKIVLTTLSTSSKSKQRWNRRLR